MGRACSGSEENRARKYQPIQTPVSIGIDGKTRRHGSAPIALEGTTTALRTIIAGETDLVTQKHLGLCYMFETEHHFVIICDDPDVFEGIADVSKRTEMIENMRDRIEAV